MGPTYPLVPHLEHPVVAEAAGAICVLPCVITRRHGVVQRSHLTSLARDLSARVGGCPGTRSFQMPRSGVLCPFVALFNTLVFLALLYSAMLSEPSLLLDSCREGWIPFQLRGLSQARQGRPNRATSGALGQDVSPMETTLRMV